MNTIHTHKKILNIKQQKGFVILFSILVSTIILLMSAGIFQIAQKEAVLSSYSRESQKALFSADAGVECALFWDISQLNTSTRFPQSQEIGTTGEGFSCGNDEDGDPLTTRAYKYDVPPFGIYDHIFGFRYGSLNQDNEVTGCAFVFVEKENQGAPDPVTGIISSFETRITAVGYNVCDDNFVPDFDDPTLLERRLSVEYSQR